MGGKDGALLCVLGCVGVVLCGVMHILLVENEQQLTNVGQDMVFKVI